MIPDSNARGDDDSVSNADDVEFLSGDGGIDIFVPQHKVAENVAKIVSCDTLVIRNLVQFDYVVSLLSACLSFRQTSKAVQENRDRLGAACTISCVSE
ncbi:unnamed protein product [Agarophyton chilense]